MGAGREEEGPCERTVALSLRGWGRQTRVQPSWGFAASAGLELLASASASLAGTRSDPDK